MAEAGGGPLFTWRIPAFAAVFAVAVILGLNWISAGRTPRDSLHRPQSLQVFVSDPTANVNLSTVMVYQERSTHPQFLEELFLTVTPRTPGENVNWAVVSLGAPIDNGSTAELSYGTDPRVPAQRAWVRYGTLAQLEGSPTVLMVDPLASENAYGHFIGGSSHIAPVVLSQGGEFFAHLPAMGLEPPPEPGVNMLLAPERNSQNLIVDESPVVRSGAQPGTTNPLDYVIRQRNAEPIGAAFSVPNNLGNNAFLELPSHESSLINYHIDSVSPVDASLQGFSFAWVGGTTIEPTLSASDPNAVQSRADDDLFAGVALAVAAAALLALIQELPRNPLWARRESRVTGPSTNGSRGSQTDRPEKEDGSDQELIPLIE